MGYVLPDRQVDAYGSEGFSIAHLSRTASVAVAHVDAGGRIGRHPADKDQVLIVLAGAAQVSGTDARRLEIRPGQAAIWRSGEAHETLALTPVTALIVESHDVNMVTIGN